MILVTLALSGTIVSLQQTLVIPLLPEFPRLLNTTADNASWLLTATLVTGAVATPTISRLGDMFGKKRMVMLTLCVMVCGSLLGAFSQAVPLLIAARAMQGVGTALIPVGISIMHDEVPRDRLPLGVAMMSATFAIGAAAGFPLSGLISSHMSWHSIFAVTAVAGIVMTVAVALVVPESSVRTGGSFDYVGALLLSLVLTATLLCLSKGGQWGWTSQPTILLMCLGVGLVVVWVPLELRVRNPLVDVRIATRPALLALNVASLLTGFAMFANLLITTQLLNLPTDSGYGLGLDVLETGLWMTPNSIVFGVSAVVSAPITRRFGALPTLFAGSVIMTLSYVARVFVSHDLWQVVAGSMLVGVGASMCFAAIPMLIMRAVPLTETTSANGLNTLLRLIGNSASSATMAAVMTVGLQGIGGDGFPSLSAVHTMLWLSAGVSMLSAIVVLPLCRFGESVNETPEPRCTTAALHDRVVSSSG